MSVAVERGRCLQVQSHVSPGNVVNSSGYLLDACMKVVLGKNLIDWWWCIVSSAFDVGWGMLPAEFSYVMCGRFELLRISHVGVSELVSKNGVSI